MPGAPGCPLGDAVGDALGAGLADVLGCPLGAAVSAALGAELDDAVGDALGVELGDAVGEGCCAWPMFVHTSDTRNTSRINWLRNAETVAFMY